MRPVPLGNPGVLDRQKAFLDNPDYPAALERRVRSLDDAKLMSMTTKLHVVAFDPGGTTGWSVMTVLPEYLLDPKVRSHTLVSSWSHGQIDCGSQSGNAADSATANDYELGISETGEAAGVFLCERLVDDMAWRGATAVVIEDFILRTQTKGRDALSPVRITAALQQLLWETKTVTVTKQQPSEAKTAITDDRLKQWGLLDRTGGGRHARDADRHALLFLRKVRESKARVLEKWPVLAEAVRRGLIEL